MKLLRNRLIVLYNPYKDKISDRCRSYPAEQLCCTRIIFNGKVNRVVAQKRSDDRRLRCTVKLQDFS